MNPNFKKQMFDQSVMSANRLKEIFTNRDQDDDLDNPDNLSNLE